MTNTIKHAYFNPVTIKACFTGDVVDNFDVTALTPFHDNWTKLCVFNPNQ